MTFAAGEVVILKSGGVAMTVIAIDEEEAVCVWTGDDGDLFRETIPMIALQIAHLSDEDDEEMEGDDEEAGEDETDAEQEAPAEDKASAA